MSQIVKLRRSSVPGQKPTNSNLQLGELALNTTDGKVYMSKSGSLGPSVEELISTNTVNTGSVNISGSISLIGNQTISGSLIVGTGNVTATEFTGSALGLTNVPYQISGSDLSGNTYNKQFTKLQFDDSSGIFVEETDTGTAYISITGTTGGVGGGSAIGSYSSLVVTNASSTWSFTHNTGQRYPIFQVFDNSGYVVIPSQIKTIDENTAEIIFPSPQTGRVIASLGGGNGTTKEFTNSALWTVNHNLNTDYPDVTVWDSNRNIIFPNRIESVNSNQVKIYFSQAISGHVSLSRGGHIVTGSGVIGSEDITWTNLLNKPNGLVSGSSQIFYSGLTGVPSSIVSGSEQLTGSYDTRYVLSGSITQTTWDNIANKPSGLISGSIQVELTGTTGYSIFSSSVSSSIGFLSSSVATTTSELTSTITTLSSSLSSSIDSLSSSVTSINNTQNGRLDSLETASGSIRTDFNTFTSSYTTVSGSIDSRLDTLENTTSSTNLNYIDFDTTPSVSSIEGRLLWNNADGTLDLGLKGGNVTLQVGQETLYEVRNETGIQIPNGTAVYANGVTVGSGRITVAPFTSNGTIRDINFLGLATENISNGVNGYVTHFGYTRGLDTRGTAASSIAVGDENWSVGDILYAHPTAAGKLTNVKPKHEISVAIIINRHQSSGVVFVRPTSFGHLFDNHDVDINTGSITTGDLLIYDSGNSVWKNSKSLEGNYVVTGSLTVTQNLTVLGSSSITYVTSSQLQVATSTISVNVYEPAERFGGLKVYDSGSSNATASLLWDSLHNHWVYQNVSGSNYSGGMLLSGPRNTGSLGDEPTLINGRIAKSVGGDHLDNSIISETGTTITIAGDLVANSITGAFDYFGLVNRPTLISGSSQIIYSGLTGIPSGIVSGSEQLTGSYDTRYVLSGSITQTTWDNIANKPSDIVSGSEQLTGSYDTRYVLSGSITQTTWDNIASKPSGIVSGSSQVIGLGFLQTSSFNTFTSSAATTGSNSFVGNQNINGNLSVTGSVVISGSLDLSSANIDNSRYLHTQTSGTTTWTIIHNLGYNYPNVTVYDADNKVMLPADVTSIDENTTQVTFAVAETGHALVSIGGISTGAADRFLFTASSTTGSWVIDHNLGYKYVNVDVYDSNDEQLLPQKITAVSVNRTQIDFATPTAGNATITIGGARSTSLFVQNGSYYNTTNNIGITGSLVVTGDVDAANFNTTSDKKLKTDLIRIEGALDKIEKLNGYTFNWLEEYSEDRTRQIGMIADEVYEVQPELISKRTILLGGKEEEIKLLDYSKVTSLLLEGIKELTDRVIKLENKRKKK